jgi:hypothetical protein
VRAPGWVDGGELALIARQHGVLIEPGDVFHARAALPLPGLPAAPVVDRRGQGSARASRRWAAPSTNSPPPAAKLAAAHEQPR